MKTSAIVTLLLIHIYLANGHSYRYDRNKKVFRSKVKKRLLEDFSRKNRLLEDFKKSSGPCPPVACEQEFIPDECRMKTYFYKNGYKCQGCDNNKCSKRVTDLKRLVKKIHSIKQKNIRPIQQKTVKVIEVHAEKEERRPSIRDNFPDILVRTPFDNVHHTDNFPESSDRLHPDIRSNLGSLSDSAVRLPQDNIRRRGSLPDLSVRLPPNNIGSLGSFSDSSILVSPDILRNEESLFDNSVRLRPDNVVSRDPSPDSSVRLFQDNVEPLSPFPGSSVRLPADSVGPNDTPVAPPPRPVSPIPAAQPDSPLPAILQDLPPPAARPDSPLRTILPDLPPPAALPVSPPVQPIITPDVGQQTRDPLSVLNAPPSDNEFANRVRFDSSNANLLLPPVDTENVQNPLMNQNTMQNPFLQNIPAPFQGQQNNNPWPQIPGFMPQNLQGGGQSPEMQLVQNQQILDQLRGQQAALEFQIQQLRGQQQVPAFGQFPMPQFPTGGIPQTQQGFPNNGIPPNFQGFPANGVNTNLQGQGFPGFVPQGFQGFGQNTNPFMTGMQQPVSNQNLGPNPNGQVSQFLNQLPPVPGINSNFQGQVPLNGNFQGQVPLNGNFPGQPPLNGNFPGQAPLNGNFPGPALTASNPWASVQGFANQGQSNVQTSNTGGFVDPVTNQALPASSNSFHGPIAQQ
ncbi:R3H domain-containing protein 2-like [Mytilus trossulus]|uniref:R3H domain-containing protein 2-like n=1 Tax=Mytilus trossulus TaxID=6551 RepID=UPI0030065DCC